jgi:hypothetical protein
MNYVKHFNSSIGDGNKSSEIIKMIAGADSKGEGKIEFKGMY